MAETSPVQQSNPADLNIGNIYPQNSNAETLSGDKTLSNTADMVQVLDPGGAGRNVDLPSDEAGLTYVVVNTASAANALTVRDDTDTTVATVSQNEACLFVNTGSGYVALLGASASDQEV